MKERSHKLSGMAITNERRVFLHVQERTRLNRRRREQLKRLGAAERRRLMKKRKVLKRMVSPFILGESKEYNIKERDPVEEMGLNDVISNMLPRDDNNIPYLKLCGGCKRLFRVTSSVFVGLGSNKRKAIRRRCSNYYFVKSNH